MTFKRKIRNCVSFLLCVAILISLSVPYAFAASDESYNKEAEEAYAFLKAVGAMDTNELPFNAGLEVTRAYFVKLALHLSGDVPNTGGLAYDVFADVTNKTNYGEYIEAAYRLGYIQGSSSGYFEPDQSISYAQAIKIICNILGYEKYADVYGGFPVGYLSVAQRIDLTDGINRDSSQNLTMADVMLLLKNAANTEIMQFDGISGDDISLDTVDGETLLFKKHSIACVDGIVEANGYTSLLYAESELAPGNIMVNNITFGDVSGNLQEYIGYNVRLFYDYESGTAIKEAKYAQILDENTLIDVLPENLYVNGGKISYYQNETTEKTLRFSSIVSYILNGKMAVMSPEDLLDIEKGSIEFISNDGNKEIDVVKVKSYQTLLVNAVSAASGIIITNDGSKIYLDPDSDEYSFKISKNNTDCDIYSISKGDVLLVAEGKDSGYHNIEILASDNCVTSAFSEIGDGYAVIDGIKYDIDSAITANIKIGNTYKIRFDVFGNVSCVEVENDMVYGFLYGVAKEGLGKIQCRIFTENDRWVTLDFADKIKYNSVSVSADALYNTLLSGENDYRQLIRYNVNSKPELIKLETYAEIPIGDENEAAAAENDTFRLSYSGSLKYRGTPKSFNGKIFVDSNTKVFNIPSDYSEDGFKVRSYSSLNSESTYTVNAFNVDEGLYSALITTSSLSAGSSVSYTDKFMVVKGVGQIVNIKGEASPSLRGYRRGSEMAFPVDTSDNGVSVDTLNSLKKGDLILFKYDEDNNIFSIKSYPADDKYYISDEDHYSTCTIIGGEVKNIDIPGKRIRLVYDAGGEELGILYTSTTSAALWDRKTETYTSADVSEILPGDIIFANTRYHVCYDIIIIRN